MTRPAASTRRARPQSADPRPAKPKKNPAPKPPRSYFQRSELPLTSLLFLLPLLILYELGTWRFASDPWHLTERRVIAFDLLQEFFRFFRASGRYLPAMAVVGILLAWHIL